MGKKVFRTILIFVLALTTLTSVAFATSNRASDHLIYYYAAASSIGSGDIEISFTVTSQSYMNKIGITSIRVYENVNRLFDVEKRNTVVKRWKVYNY